MKRKEILPLPTCIVTVEVSKETISPFVKESESFTAMLSVIFMISEMRVFKVEGVEDWVLRFSTTFPRTETTAFAP